MHLNDDDHFVLTKGRDSTRSEGINALWLNGINATVDLSQSQSAVVAADCSYESRCVSLSPSFAKTVLLLFIYLFIMF